MNDTMLDGSAISGLFSEVFAADLATAVGTCGRCGVGEALGAAHAYQGAGVVLRCRHCGDPLVKIVRADARTWIAFPGLHVLEVSTAEG